MTMTKETLIAPYGLSEPLRPAEVSVIVPAFNECSNVPLIVDAISVVMGDISWEVVFVDDNSPDGTAACARALAQRNMRVRVIQRYGRRGLSSACVEGILSSAAPIVAVMDCDLQHDEALLPRMLEILKSQKAELVVGSRYVAGGSIGDWTSHRANVSKLATRMATMLTRTPITDPMSGFFMMTREAFERSLPRLSSVGFKILLDIAASAPVPLRIIEIPYTFRLRQHGQSKLDALVLWEYFQLILDKSFGRVIPVRFISFALVGTIGLLIHFSVLSLLYIGLKQTFSHAQTFATLIAISCNFLFNNLLTYRDQRLRGPALIRGWITFNIVCATGAAANVGVADWLFTHRYFWVASAIAGVMISVVWNYAMSSIFTWRRKG